MRAGVVLLVAAIGCVVAVAAASTHGAPSSGRLRVVAAENVWGSLAAQLGGDRVDLTTVISSPATDPHDYEPTAVDARALAGAKLVIENGIGYDSWAQKLVDANPLHGRIVLDVGDLVGVGAGGNPHRWYSPADVRRVIAAVAADYRRLDPRGAASYARRRRRLERHGLATYDRLVATIARRYRDVAVGASEGVFAPLAQALRLDLITPPSFLKAVSEGTEPTARDTQTVERQIARGQVRVWVYNSQNSTPDVARITEAARRHGIPVVTITETLSPATASFQSWQVGQLRALAAALHRAIGR